MDDPHPGAFRVNFNAVIGSGEVGIGAVVCDFGDDTLLVMEKVQPFIRSMELVEALAL